MVYLQEKTETARKAVKTVCKHLYNHDFYLPIEEAQADTVEVCEPEPKRSKRPMTKKDYENYEFVLPSAKTISDYKYLQASQTESDVALAMIDKAEDVKITLHYDTTSRNSIDGEWPSIVINFSDKQHFRLRPLFFTYEDRAQIARLIVESFERLACAFKKKLCPLKKKFIRLNYGKRLMLL